LEPGENDIGGQNDLADQYPTEVTKLAVLLSTTLRDRNALMPLEKATEKAVPFPNEITLK